MADDVSTTTMQSGNVRIAVRSRLAGRRRALELLVLTAASLALLFSLGVAFGLVIS